CGKDDFKKTRDRDAHLNRKFSCILKILNPITTPIVLLQNPATNQIPTQTYVPVDDLIQLDSTPSSSIQNISSDNVSSNLPQNDTEWFDNMKDKYNINTDKKWSELAETLLYDYSKKNIIKIEGNFGNKPVRKNYRLTNKELIFKECESNLDPLRPHQNLTAMSLWQAIPKI
ncbi:3051_t:CDS:1, partial [Racocetra persica]